MVLPLISLYVLYSSVSAYQSDQKVEEYYDAYADIQQMTAVLDDPKWYESADDKKQLDELATDDMAIELYNKDGVKLYHSNPDLDFEGVMNQEQLYKDLYEVQEGLQAYTYKEPVFDDQQLVGVFNIEIGREALVDTIVKRSWIVIGLFLASFILVYAIVIYFVHKRVTKRLYRLMNEITAFASGNMKPETPVEKDEIGELKSHFYSMRKQVVSAQEAIKKEQQEKEFMVAAISHDLKTPLTSIKAYAEALEEPEELHEKKRESYQRTISEKTDFIKQMLDDLMTYSLLQSSDYNMEVVTVDGEEFFDMLLSDYTALCDQKSIQLQTYSNAPGEYNVNPKQMIRVCDNLMSNAITHTPVHGEIKLLAVGTNAIPHDWLFDYVMSQYTFDVENNAYLIVQNEGEGIHEEAKQQLFQPLYQMDQARNKTDGKQGTGLGLSITQQIIEKHDGDVTVLSKEKQGACFICRIPKRREQDGHLS